MAIAVLVRPRSPLYHADWWCPVLNRHRQTLVTRLGDAEAIGKRPCESCWVPEGYVAAEEVTV